MSVQCQGPLHILFFQTKERWEWGSGLLKLKPQGVSASFPLIWWCHLGIGVELQTPRAGWMFY